MKYECIECSHVFKHNKYVSKNFCISRNPIVCPACRCALLEDFSNIVNFKYENHALLVGVVCLVVFAIEYYSDVNSFNEPTVFTFICLGLLLVSGLYIAASNYVNLWYSEYHPTRTKRIEKNNL
jgi:hypothetical protein